MVFYSLFPVEFAGDEVNGSFGLAEDDGLAAAVRLRHGEEKVLQP